MLTRRQRIQKWLKLCANSDVAPLVVPILIVALFVVGLAVLDFVPK